MKKWYCRMNKWWKGPVNHHADILRKEDEEDGAVDADVVAFAAAELKRELELAEVPSVSQSIEEVLEYVEGAEKYTASSSGETPETVAKKIGVAADALVMLNAPMYPGLSRSSCLMEGMVLKVPVLMNPSKKERSLIESQTHVKCSMIFDSGMEYYCEEEDTPKSVASLLGIDAKSLQAESSSRKNQGFADAFAGFGGTIMRLPLVCSKLRRGIAAFCGSTTNEFPGRNK